MHCGFVIICSWEMVQSYSFARLSAYLVCIGLDNWLNAFEKNKAIHILPYSNFMFIVQATY